MGKELAGSKVQRRAFGSLPLVRWCFLWAFGGLWGFPGALVVSPRGPPGLGELGPGEQEAFWLGARVGVWGGEPTGGLRGEITFLNFSPPGGEVTLVWTGGRGFWARGGQKEGA